jgi:hypothetical protein
LMKASGCCCCCLLCDWNSAIERLDAFGL